VTLDRSGGGLPPTSDAVPCDAAQVARLGRRVQHCPLFRAGTPVYDSPDEGNAAKEIGSLRTGGPNNWFVGRAERSTFRSEGIENRWWAFTLSDRTWGWVPEVDFSGGADNERDAGLRLCDTADNPCRE
jgi:hypothetical protein